MSNLINWLNKLIPFLNLVPIWKVIVVGLPVALVVHLVFSSRKRLGFLQPILWVVLTVAVLLLWSDKGGNGKGGDDTGGKDKPVAEKTTEPEEPPSDSVEGQQGEGAGGSSAEEQPKPVALKISANDDGTFTIEDVTNNKSFVSDDYVNELKKMESNGYQFTQIETRNLSYKQFNDLKTDYKKYNCNVFTTEGNTQK